MSVSTSEAPDIFSEAHARDPHATYRVLRDEFPVVYHEGSKSWLVSRHEDIVHLLKRKDVTSDVYSQSIAPVHGHTIIEMEGKQHTMHRRLLSPFFHRDGLESFKPVIAKVARELAEPFLTREADAVRRGEKQRGEVDLAVEFFHQFPISVIENMLGLPKERHRDFERWYTAIMEYIDNLQADPARYERGLQAKKEMTEYFLPLIAERRKGDGTDLLTMMCQAEVDGEQLSDEEVRAFVSLMITAGGETTDRAQGNMFMRLLEHPDQLEAVYENPDLVVDAFAETLRHTPPVHVASRTPQVDIEMHGVTIPAGDTITCLVSAGSRDPRKFEDPDRFDIFREDNSTERAFSAAADHLGFINGRHFCVGAMLARAEIEIGVRYLLENMPGMKMAEGFVPVESGLFTRGLDSLKVTYDPIV